MADDQCRERDAAGAEHGDPRRQNRRVVADREEFAGTGGLAESGREVHGPTDVVVAVNDEDLTVRDAASQGEGVEVVAGDEFGRGRDGGTGIHADDHGAITEPLADDDATAHGEIAGQCAETADRINRRVFAVRFNERGEAAQVQEGEGSLNRFDRAGDLTR